MNKTEIRQKYKSLRQELTTKEIDDKSLTIANNLLNLKIWDKTYFHIYLPIDKKKEVNTEFILQILAGKDKEIIVSKSDFETINMTHFLLTDNTKFTNNQYNIPEPVDGIAVPDSKIEVVFVPLLAYDLKGHRVGYGKGFYDLFLSKCKPDSLKIGLSFFEPEQEIDGIYENDVQLDFCITPVKIYTF